MYKHTVPLLKQYIHVRPKNAKSKSVFNTEHLISKYIHVHYLFSQLDTRGKFTLDRFRNISPTVDK